MSKSTIVMLVLFVALGVGWMLMNQGPKEAEHPAVSVQGFVNKDVSLQDVKILNKDDESPYTSWTVKRKGETFTLDRVAGQSKKKHSESKWKATRTHKGGKMAHKGEPYRVRMYAQTIARSFRSSYSFEANEDELAEYGLDKENRIEVTASGGDKKVHLIIGKVDKAAADDESTAKTWVMRPDVKGVVYQVAGHDLRKNFDVPYKDVRDRKILDFTVAKVDKVVLENPADPLAKKVIVTRPALPKEQVAKLAEIAKETDKDKREKLEKEIRKSNDGWKIVQPTGFAVGEVGSWLESVERMALTENVDTEDGKAPKGSGLDDAKVAVRISIFEGDKKTVVVMGKAKEDGEKDVWCKVDGNDKEAFQVASWSAEQVIKGLDDLRDTKLFGKAAMDTVKAADNLVIDSPAGRFAARLENGTWIARGVRGDHKKIKEFIDDIAGLDVDYESGMSRTQAGLDKPEWRVTLSAKGGSYQVALSAKGGATGGEDFFGAVGDKGHVFKLQSWSADRLRKDGTHLKDKHLVFGATKASITSLVVPGAEKKGVKLLRDGGAWKTDPADAKTKLKVAEIDKLAGAVAEAVYDTEITGKTLKDLGLELSDHTLGFTTGKDSYTLRFSSQNKDGNPYIALFKGGKPVVIGTMASYAADSLKKKLSDLKQ